MNTKEIINGVAQKMKDSGGIRQIFLVACGGSLVDMYPVKYFLDSESTTLHVGMYTSNEFVYATPKTLGKNSLVIVCSHGGNTPESVAAAKLAQQYQAQTITLTHNAQAKLSEYANHNILYAWGNDTNVVDNPMAIIMNLCVDALQLVEGYQYYDDFQQGMTQINGVIAQGRQQVAERCQRFAQKYQNEKLFYVLSSGASYGHAYGFAICSLMEMQWLHASSIHSGEYFHGPFEVTDKETPYILLMNEGRTRVLDERALTFLNTYAEKVEVVDAKELGIGVIPPTVVEFFNPVLFYSIMCEYRSALAEIRQHPLETRRYMGLVKY